MNFLKLFRHPVALVDLTPDQLLDRLSQQPVLVDVRTPGEYRAGHIDGAISCPLGSEASLLVACPLDSDIILICKTGHRSQAAADTLLGLGFRRVSHLQGGMGAWRRAGNPTLS
jgi:rhodanese-related sulfurtransferase